MINSILKLSLAQITLIFNLTLAGAAIVIMLVLWPMIYRIQAIGDQESLLAKDIRLVNGLEKDHPDPPLIVMSGASKVMQEIVDLGNKDSVTFLSMVNEDKSKLAYKKINSLPIDLEIQGTYKQLGQFMGGLNDLSRGIVLIDSFQMKMDAKEADKVKAKILLYICLKFPPNPQKALKDPSASHRQALSFIKDYSSAIVPVKSAASWGIRDPFFIEAVKESNNDIKVKIKAKAEVVYSLSGIFWNEQKPSAIINGLVVNVGSVIGPSKVKEISPQEVILFDGTKNIVLNLREAERT
jgi:hypothetical protein